ncbi:MAG TPA: sulfatase [Phycisphaerae bacterium]|nr:sulfatase [Phycisphaerae bacterium]
MSFVGFAMPTWAQQTTPTPISNRPNVLLITVDDMNWDSPGCFGSPVPDITPNIDRLASQGMRFTNAHVTVAVCTPSRSVLLTGLYPHRNGAEGFQRIRPEVPTLPEALGEAGYLCGTIGKWLGQQEKFKWSDALMHHDEGGALPFGRDPNAFHQFACAFFDKARLAGRPFFLMANSHDPHRPFHGSTRDRQRFHSPASTIPDPSRIYRPDEIRVPGFLPDLPDIRTELAQYCSSVRRADDTVGAVLKALHESGQEPRTLVMFLSDNGMPFPFAKANCYPNSTRTPWIVRWPGRVKAGAVDREHLISGLDFMPTVIEAAGIAQPKPMDGLSFLPLLRGDDQAGRDLVFTQFHHIHGKNPLPMRCVQSRRFAYIFNPWSDGKRIYTAESMSDLTFAAMKKTAETDPAVRRRVQFLQYRAVEEFYDLQNDPDALHNLVVDPRYAVEVERMRRQLLDGMEKTGDPAAEAFRHRESPEALARFMRDYSAKAAREIEELQEYENRTGYRF